jgi:hypothetical protein
MINEYQIILIEFSFNLKKNEEIEISNLLNQNGEEVTVERKRDDAVVTQSGTFNDKEEFTAHIYACLNGIYGGRYVLADD